MKYDDAKKMVGWHAINDQGKDDMRKKGALLRYKAVKDGWRKCAHRKAKDGYDYTVVFTSSFSGFKGERARGYYSLHARKLSKKN